MHRFGYASALVGRYPQLVAGVLFVSGLRNSQTPPELDALLKAEESRVSSAYRTDMLSTLPSVAAWRAAYSAFGAKPSQYRSAVEALLRRAAQAGALPRLNALVDICNCVSLRVELPVAAFDLDQLQGDVTVGFATGAEKYVGLGETQTEPPYEGEVIYTDAAGVAHSRRWNWRQSAVSGVSEATTRALVTTEAMHAEGRAAVESAVRDLAELVSRFCGGAVQTFVLDAGHPATGEA